MRYLAVLLLLCGCASTVTVLENCAIEISTSSQERDALVCSNHPPIRLDHVDPRLREAILSRFGGQK